MPSRALAFALLAAVLVACTSADSGTPSPTPTADPTETSTHTATATVTPEVTNPPSIPSPTEERSTGDAGLDAIIEAVEARDVGALAGYVDLQTLGCTHAPGMGGPPKCEDQQQEGDEVAVFPVTSCEPEWHRWPVWIMGMLVHAAQGLYVVAEAPAGFEPAFGGPAVDTLLVFHAERNQGGFRLNVTDGRITSLTMGCDTTLEDFASLQGQALPTTVGPFTPRPPQSVAIPSTGESVLDSTLAAIASYDFGTLFEDASRAMRDAPPVECVEELEGPGGILCEEGKGETPGTEVHVFPSAYCEGSYARDPSQPLQAFLNLAPVLHSVYEAPAQDSGSPIYRNGEWWAVYEFTAPDAFPEAARVHVGEDGAILVMWYGCEATLESVTQGAGAEVAVTLED